MKNSKFILKTELMRKSFFLFGLVIALGAAHSALSYRLVETFSFPEIEKTVSIDDGVVIPITLYPKEPIPKKQKEIKKIIKRANNDPFIVVDDWTLVDDPGEEPLGEVVSTHEEAVEEVFFYSLDRKPIYNGCETLDSDEEKFECFQHKLGIYVRDNFKSNSNGWGTSEKMTIKFEIDQEGFVSDVKIARGDESDKIQMENIIKTLPQFTPGMYKGKYVKTSYILPVVIRN
jgi:protein TonB